MDIRIRRNYLFVCSSCFLAAREKIPLSARYDEALAQGK